MQLSHIAVFAVGALLYAAFAPPRWRGWLLLIASVIALYWLQATLTIRYLDFALPTATLVLTVAMWWVTRPALPPRNLTSGLSLSGRGENPLVTNPSVSVPSLHNMERGPGGEVKSRFSRDDLLTLVVLVALVLALAATRYLVPELRPTASRAPDVLAVGAALVPLAGLFHKKA